MLHVEFALPQPGQRRCTVLRFRPFAQTRSLSIPWSRAMAQWLHSMEPWAMHRIMQPAPPLRKSIWLCQLHALRPCPDKRRQHNDAVHGARE